MALDPFVIMETLPGNYSLVLSALEETMRVFEEAGHTGNGYAWQAIAVHVCEEELGDLADHVDFDCEAGMFCAYGRDKAALTALGSRLTAAARDPAILAELIAAVPAGLWDD